MSVEKRLRQQVVAELRLRNLVIYTLLTLSLLYITATLVFGDSGLIRYWEIKQRSERLETEVASIEADNRRLERVIQAVEQDNFYLEKHAREEFGLLREDEYVFILKNDGSGEDPAGRP